MNSLQLVVAHLKIMLKFRVLFFLNKFLWNFNQNLDICIQVNAF